jgi:hypothetical protein
MTAPRDAIAVVQKIIDVYSGDITAIFGNADRLAEARAITDPLFHPDLEARMPPTLDLGDEMRGADALAETWRQWLEVFGEISQTHGEPELLPDGRVWVTTETVVTLSSGQQIPMAGASVWEIGDDGRVLRMWWGPSEHEVRQLAGLTDEAKTPPA